MRRDEDDVGSAHTAAAAGVATAETVATASGATALANSETMASSGATGAIAPETLVVVAPSVYVQLDEFARGGLGRIIRAKDTRTGRIVAIKEMLSTTEDAALRFAREAMITANLMHPAIVPVYEVGRWTSGQPFYAMKLVSGRPLDQVIATTKTVDDRLALVSHVLAVADALAYAHGERVIHRDLKPHNVLVGAHGETVVIDWGLARRIDDGDQPATPHRVNSAVPGQTYVGAVMGTPAYMPPEQARGVRVDERADVYAIGAILYHVLAGKPPYVGKTLDELLGKVKAGPPTKLRVVDPSIPADLAAIVEHAMEREPAQRYSSAAELAADLRRFTNGQLVGAHHYTRAQRLARIVAHNRAAVLVATIAIIGGAIGGTLAVRNIVAARDTATSAQASAESARDEARRRLVDAHADRARAELAAKHDDLALAFAVSAAELGGLDERLRFIVARALASQAPISRLAAPDITAVATIPKVHDVIVSTRTGLRRWDPTHGRVLWERTDGMFASDVYVLDETTMMTVRIGGVELFDPSTGAVIDTLRVADAKFIGLSGVDPSRRWLAAPLLSGATALFDLRTRRLVTKIPTKSASGTPVVGPGGERIAVVSSVSDIQSRAAIVDRDGREIAELCGNCVIVRAVGDDLVVAEVSTRLPAKIRIVDWNGAIKRELFASASGDVADLVPLPDGKLFALVLGDGTIDVHDKDAGLVWRRSTGERGASLYIDKVGRLWVQGNLRNTASFDARTGVPIGSWLTGGFAIVVSDDGRRVTSIVLGRGPASFEPTTSLQVVAPSNARVRKLVFAPDGRLVTGSEDGLVAVIEGGNVRTIARHPAKVISLQLAGREVLSTSKAGVAYLHDLETGTLVSSLARGSLAAASPDGSSIVIGADNGEVITWDRTTTRLLGKLTAPIAGVRWSEDGSKFGAIDENGELEVWDRSGASLLRIRDRANRALDLRFSNRGTYVARSIDTTRDVLYAIDPTRTNIELEDSTSEPRYSLWFAFSSNDTQVALAGTGKVSLWDLPSGKLHHSFSVATDSITAAFSKSDSFLFSGGVDRRARVWDVASGLEITSIEATHEVYGLALDADGGRIAILTLGSAMLWDIRPFEGTLEELKRLAACRVEMEVIEGAIKRRPIDEARCRTDR